jgi:hypothetical protein
VPVTYRIDPGRHLVVSRAWGILTDDDIEAHYKRLVEDPGFEPTFRQLCDMMGVTRIDVSTEVLRRLARQSIFAPGTQRAFVAAQDAHYGLTRMFQVFCELEGTRVEVFRDTASGESWLETATAPERGEPV